MGFNVGGALAGGLGGFAVGGWPGAIAGGLAGGMSEPPQDQENESSQTAWFETDNTSTTKPLGFQLNHIKNLLGRAESVFSNRDPQTVGFTDLQKLGQRTLVNESAPQVGQLAGQSADSLGFLLSPDLLSPDSNPYLAASAQASINPLLRTLQRDILPGIASGAVSANGIGSSRQGVAEANAITDFNQIAADSLAQQYSNAYQQGLGTMLAANAQAPALAQLLQAEGNIYNQVGLAQQQQAQLEREEELRRLLQFNEIVSQNFGSTTSNRSGGQSGQQGTNIYGAPNEGPFAAFGGGLAIGDLVKQSQNNGQTGNNASNVPIGQDGSNFEDQ